MKRPLLPLCDNTQSSDGALVHRSLFSSLFDSKRLRLSSELQRNPFSNLSVYDRIFKTSGIKPDQRGGLSFQTTPSTDPFIRPIGFPPRTTNITNIYSPSPATPSSSQRMSIPSASGPMPDDTPTITATTTATVLSSTPFVRPENARVTAERSTPSDLTLYRRMLNQATTEQPMPQHKSHRTVRVRPTDKVTIVIDDTISSEDDGLKQCSISPIRPYTQVPVPSKSTSSDRISSMQMSRRSGGEEQARSWLRACEQTPYLSEQWLNNLTTNYQARAQQRDMERQLVEAKVNHFEKQRVMDHRRQMDCIEQRLSCLLLTPSVLHDPYLVPQPIPIELPYQPRKVASLAAIPVLPELDESQLAQVNAIIRGGSPDGVVVENFRLIVTRKEILTLTGTNWLSDMVINFYMQLLYKRSQENQQQSEPSKIPRIAVLTTFFYAKLTSTTGLCGYAGVRRWSRQLQLLDQDLVLIPIHDRGMHWCLACIDLKSKSISYYDSMGSGNDRCLRNLMSYLKSECEDKKGYPLPDPDSWQLINTQDTIPQQMNGSDCGVFMCTFGEFLSRGSKFTFSQDDMPGIRKRMIYEIVTQQLLTTGFKVQ